MKVVNLTQGTPEWLAWRQTGVSASDVAAILGRSPYKTKWHLWAEKSGLRAPDDLSNNPAVWRGKTYEDLLRRHLTVERKLGIMPLCIEHDEVAILKASLDGIDRFGRPWEFKIPHHSNFLDVRQNGRESKQFIQYQPQVQHQMLCAGAKDAFLVFGDVDDLSNPPRVRDYILFPIAADTEMQSLIMAEVLKFHNDVLTGIEPKKDPEKDIFVPKAGEEILAWNQAASLMIPMLFRKLRLEDELKVVNTQIEEASKLFDPILGEFKKAEFGQMAITRYTRKGSVDWSEYVKLKGDNPEDDEYFDKFRKEESKQVRFKLRM